MSQVTKIEWTDVSWNPVHGCSRVSTGCKHCYAETLSLRYGQTTAPWTKRNEQQNVMLKPHKLREPLSKAGPWKQPCRVFVNSMSDLFHEQIPDEYIGQVLNVILFAGYHHGHVFQVLTKRPERMRDCMRRYYSEGGLDGTGNPSLRSAIGKDTIPWLWLGVSIENRKWVGRADVLRQVPAAVRFISAEPLLGPLVPDGATGGGDDCEAGASWRDWSDRSRNDHGRPVAGLDLTGINWLIVGGESGPGHRPFDPQWARDLRDAAAATAIGDERPDCAFFMKQTGGARPGTKLEDLPEDLRSREFPS